jgi:hypothetical protein
MAKYKVPKEKFDRTAGDPRRVAFERLFERRIEALKEDARLLMNLSNPYNYSYGPEDAERLRKELTLLARTTVDAFENRLSSQAALSKKRTLER